MLADVCGASDVWCTGLWCCSLAVWLWLGWFVGDFDCAIDFVVLGDAGILLLSPCNTCIRRLTMNSLVISVWKVACLGLCP